MESQRRWTVLLVLAAALTRLYTLLTARGYIYPDDLFQLVEPAHRLVFGYGLVPWEYVYGMRSWFQPLMVVALMKAGLFAGIRDMASLVFINRAAMTVMSFALLYAVWKLAYEIYGRLTALYAVFFSIFSYLLWRWSADVNSHIPSALFVTASLFFFWRGWSNKSAGDYALSGCCLGMAFVFRFDALIFLLPLTAFIAWSRKPSKTPYFIAGLLVLVLFQGVLDYFTWGSFLHSPLEYVRQNLLLGKSTIFGREPPYFYVQTLFLHFPALLFMLYAAERKDSYRFLALTLVVFLALFSLVTHKEERLIIPVLPLLCILGARGMEKALNAYGRAIIVVVVIPTAVLGAVLVNYIPDLVAIDAETYVGAQPDATGYATTVYWPYAGGYSSLHKPIPLVQIGDDASDLMFKPVKCGKPDMEIIGFQCANVNGIIGEPGINYAYADEGVGAKLQASGFDKVADFGTRTLYRRRPNLSGQ